MMHGQRNIKLHNKCVVRRTAKTCASVITVTLQLTTLISVEVLMFSVVGAMATDYNANPIAATPLPSAQEAPTFHNVTYSTVARAAPLQKPSTLLLTE